MNLSYLSGRPAPAALALTLSMSLPLACDSTAEPLPDASHQHDEGDGSSQDSNQASDANGSKLGVDAKVEAVVVLDINEATALVNSELTAAAKVGQSLVAHVRHLGSTNPWTLVFKATGQPQVKVTTSQTATATGTTTTSLFDTTGLAAGTYDLEATFSGNVANVVTEVTLTVHVTLTAAAT